MALVTFEAEGEGMARGEVNGDRRLSSYNNAAVHASEYAYHDCMTCERLISLPGLSLLLLPTLQLMPLIHPVLGCS